jgi:hypothetical protein
MAPKGSGDDAVFMASSNQIKRIGLGVCRIFAMGIVGALAGGIANIPRFLLGGRYLDYQGHVMLSQILFLPGMMAQYFILSAIFSELLVFPFRRTRIFWGILGLIFMAWEILFLSSLYHPAQSSRYLRLSIITLSGVGFVLSFVLMAKKVSSGRSKIGMEIVGSGAAIVLFALSAFLGGLIFGFHWHEFDHDIGMAVQLLGIGSGVLATCAAIIKIPFLRKLDG